MTNVSRKCKAVWNILNQHDLLSLIVGWWPSHPAEPINGVMVSDYFHKAPKKPGDEWNLMKKSVHPPELLQEVADCRMHPLEISPEHVLPFIPHAKDVDQKKDARLSAVMKILAECTTIHATSTHLLETQSWDFCAIYNDSIDHFCHGFMKYRPPQQEYISDDDYRLYQHVVSAAYIYHDMMLKRLLELAGEDTTVVLISDHGFHPDHLRPRKISSEPAGPAGEHRDFGIFLAMGPGIKKDHVIHGANLLDVAPTLLSLYDLPVGADMDGQVLSDIFANPRKLDSIPSWDEVAGEDGQHPEGMTMDAVDTKAALDQLVALGYIEPPTDDANVEVEKSKRELDYNLARSYMDAEMHGAAIPLLNQLYCKSPLEYRFGVQLCNCLKAMGRIDEMEQVVNHLNSSWRIAAVESRKKIAEIARIGKERREHWNEIKRLDQERANAEAEGGQSEMRPDIANEKPRLFDESERFVIRKLRAVARGNPQTLDYLAAVVATSRDDFEGALDYLERAELTKSPNPGFQYHVGNVYLGLKRYKDAERAFQRAIELDEFHPNALMGLCRTFLESGRKEKALEFGRQAVGLKFHFPLGHFFYANARNANGDSEGAIASLKQAVKQNPNFVQAHEMLAELYGKSQIDSELALEHKAAARSFETQNDTITSEFEAIELPSIDVENIVNELPELSDGNTEQFVRCLGQPKEILPVKLAEAEKKSLPDVIVVSGLPRSGTSMMMQMLVAGGLEPFTDGKRDADESNPKGYYEADIVKQLGTQNSWISQCDGKVVKVVAPLIPNLPQAARYRVVYMHREISEVLASQTAMLKRLNENNSEQIPDDRLAVVYEFQTQQALRAIRIHGHPLLIVSYREAIDDPTTTALKVAEFLEIPDMKNMADAVERNLYREKTQPDPRQETEK